MRPSKPGWVLSRPVSATVTVTFLPVNPPKLSSTGLYDQRALPSEM
jgi:hypothetical protein